MAKEKSENTGMEELRKKALTAGLWVLLMLGVFTVGEYLIAVIAPPWTLLLFIAAIFKAYYVIKEYMHIGRLFAGEEESH